MQGNPLNPNPRTAFPSGRSQISESLAFPSCLPPFQVHEEFWGILCIHGSNPATVAMVNIPLTIQSSSIFHNLVSWILPINVQILAHRSQPKSPIDPRVPDLRHRGVVRADRSAGCRGRGPGPVSKHDTPLLEQGNGFSIGKEVNLLESQC